MKRAVVLFALVGGLGVPVAFTLAAWLLGRLAPAADDALALLRDAQLPLWPMSKLFVDDRSGGRHWLYLPLAAVLSNALIYAAVGALAAVTRRRAAAFAVLVAAVVAIVFAASRAFGTSSAAFAVAALCAVAGLALYRGGARRR